MTTTAAWAQAPGAAETGPQTTFYGDPQSGGLFGTSNGSEASPRSVAMDLNGNSAYVWADQQTPGTSSSNGAFNLMVEQSDASGNTIEPATTVVANSNLPYVMVAREQTASTTSSEFVVVWDVQTGNNPYKYNGVTYATYAQLYNASFNGTSWSTTAVGGRILVGGKGDHIAGSVAMDGAGNFDVLYYTQASGSGGGYTWSVQRFTSTGAANGKPINVAATGWEVNAGGTQGAIAMDAAGDFVVAYQTSNSSGYVIDAQRFNSAGTATSAVVPVSAPSSDLIQAADVAMDSTGDYVVAWNETPANSRYASLYARVFYANGTSTSPVPEATPLLTTNSNGSVYASNAVYNLQPAAIVMQPTGAGAFDLTWTAFTNDAPGTNGNVYNQYEVYAQPFDSSGVATQAPITVYQSEIGSSSPPPGWSSAAIDSKNDLLVVYSINPADTPPTDPSTGLSMAGTVFAQFYPDPPALVAPTTTASTTSSPTGSASASGSTTTATDALFATYAYPGDDEMLG